MTSRKIFQDFLYANFFMFTLLMIIRIFLVQFEINLHLWVFQEDKSALPKRLVQFQLFEKLMITRAN